MVDAYLGLIKIIYKVMMLQRYWNIILEQYEYKIDAKRTEYFTH